MALYFNLMGTTSTGGVQQIGHFEAVRIAGTVEIGIDASIGHSWWGIVEHRYGDGAWELVAKALAVARIGMP